MLPVELDENRGDVVRWFGASNDLSGWVVNDLQTVDECGGDSGEEGIVVVDVGCEKWVD